MILVTRLITLIGRKSLMDAVFSFFGMWITFAWFIESISSWPGWNSPIIWIRLSFSVGQWILTNLLGSSSEPKARLHFKPITVFWISVSVNGLASAWRSKLCGYKAFASKSRAFPVVPRWLCSWLNSILCISAQLEIVRPWYTIELTAFFLAL